MLLFLKLIVGHCIADFPGQGDFLARAKNHREPIRGVLWYQALLAHAIIQGGMVGYITGRPWLGIVEFVLHAAIDWLKSEGLFTFNEDQIAHVACKLFYVTLLALISRL